MKITKVWAQAAGAGGAAYLAIHCIAIIAGSEKSVMSWLYDDAFYYMIVAKHFSDKHISSFDGMTLTSGYHPLWMWLCAAVYSTRDRLDLTYIRLCMGMGACISMGLLLGCLLIKNKTEKTGWLWALGLAATSYSALNNGMTVMEWPIVLLFWTMLHWLLLSSLESGNDGPGTLPWVTVLESFLLGVGGSLSRTDFLLIPVSYLIGSLVILKRSKNRTLVTTAGMSVVGSGVGIGIDLRYNYVMTGSWLQQSAQVKHVFASLAAPFNPVPTLWQFARVMVYLPPLILGAQQRTKILQIGLWLLLPVLVLAIGLVALRWHLLCQKVQSAWGGSESNIFALTSAMTGLLAYLFTYSFNSQATYGWYTATVTGFILIVVAEMLSQIGNRISALIVLPLMALNIALAQYYGGNANNQYGGVNAGKLLHQDHPTALMGGGDVGKPSFYNNGTMVNLDGLMNDEVLSYLVAGRFQCYVLKRKIEYLSNAGTISEPVTNIERAKRGEEPLPWNEFFVPVQGHISTGEPGSYLRTNFDAIRRFGECVD